jgi:hypothetical protein
MLTDGGDDVRLGNIYMLFLGVIDDVVQAIAM